MYISENESNESKLNDINDEDYSIFCDISLLLIKTSRKYDNHEVITMYIIAIKH